MQQLPADELQVEPLHELRWVAVSHTAAYLPLLAASDAWLVQNTAADLS